MATSTIPNSMPYIRLESYQFYVSADFAARDHQFVGSLTPISGYTPLLIHSFANSNQQHIDNIWVDLNTSGSVVGLCTSNQTGSTDNFYVYLTVGWVRDDLIG